MAHRRTAAVRSARIAALAAGAAVLAGCWPMPGGGPDRQSSNPFEDTLTVETVHSLDEAFRVSLPDPPGAPVVTTRGLFVSSRLRLHAFDRETGAPRWDRQLARPQSDDPSSFPDSAAVVNDPFVDDGEVIVTDRRSSHVDHDHRLSTVDVASGEILAQEGAVGMLLARRGDRIAVAGDAGARFPEISRLEVEDLVSGQTWDTLSNTPTSLTLGAERLYATEAGVVRAFDLVGECVPMPTVNPDICLPAWSTNVDGEPSTVVIGDGGATLFTATSAGTLYALEAATGEVRWSTPLGSAAAAAPALTGGTLYVGTTAGHVVAVPSGGCGAATCAPAWTSEAAAPVTVQPVVAGGVVYAGSADGTVRAFAARGCRTGCRPRWSADAGAAVDGGMAVAFGHLYVGTADGIVAYRGRPEPPRS